MTTKENKMNLDNLTIGEAKALARTFAGLTETTSATTDRAGIFAGLIGHNVVVRSSQSGVWMGTLVEASGDTMRLVDARRIYYWTGAATCSGLATHGPATGKIPAAVDSAVVLGCCEVVLASDAAMSRLAAVPAWVA
jgi:hypothetical protein